MGKYDILDTLSGDILENNNVTKREQRKNNNLIFHK